MTRQLSPAQLMNIHVRFLGVQRALVTGRPACRQPRNRATEAAAVPPNDRKPYQTGSLVQVYVRDITRLTGNASYYDGWRYVNYANSITTQIMQVSE